MDKAGLLDENVDWLNSNCDDWRTEWIRDKRGEGIGRVAIAVAKNGKAILVIGDDGVDAVSKLKLEIEGYARR